MWPLLEGSCLLEEGAYFIVGTQKSSTHLRVALTWSLVLIRGNTINILKIDNLETLFVLANLQIPVKPPLQYENEVAHLEENN